MNEINRYTYDVNEPEDFEKLLNFWTDKEIYHPVFIQWHDPEQRPAATYFFETEWYRASVTIHRDTPEEVSAALSSKSLENHELIECRVYAGDAEHEE